MHVKIGLAASTRGGSTTGRECAVRERACVARRAHNRAMWIRVVRLRQQAARSPLSLFLPRSTPSSLLQPCGRRRSPIPTTVSASASPLVLPKEVIPPPRPALCPLPGLLTRPRVAQELLLLARDGALVARADTPRAVRRLRRVALARGHRAGDVRRGVLALDAAGLAALGRRGAVPAHGDGQGHEEPAAAAEETASAAAEIVKVDAFFRAGIVRESCGR